MPDQIPKDEPDRGHRWLKPFVGTFKATVKMWMGPGDPHVSTGVMVNREVLGGNYLEQVYKGDQSEGPFQSFEGRGFWGFNTTTNQYEAVWIDNASTAMQFDYGSVDESGSVWTTTGEVVNPRDGKRLKKRGVIRLENLDHHTMETYFTPEGGQEFKAMVIDYLRVT